MLYTLLALALGPGIAIMLYIYWRDNHDREPVKHLIICFLLGLLSIVPAVLIEQWLSGVQVNIFEARSVSGQLFSAYIVAATVEEIVKFAFCRLYAYPKKDFNEPLDGIVYMVMVAMGFATLENVFYIFNDAKGGIGTGVMRMFLAVPGHACWGVIIGYFMGLAKFKQSGIKRVVLMITGLLLAILLHGTYDGLLFIQETDTFQGYALPLFGGAVLTAVVSYLFAFSAIKKHRRLSHEMFVLNKNG
jgi:protease PrsW